MPIDNNYYAIQGTELGEIQALLNELLEGDTPSQEEVLDVMSYVTQAFQQPTDPPSAEAAEAKGGEERTS